jgi:hypothetical protein
MSFLACFEKRPLLETSRQFYPKTEKRELSFVLFTRSRNQSLTYSFIPSFNETLLKHLVPVTNGGRLYLKTDAIKIVITK